MTLNSPIRRLNEDQRFMLSLFFAILLHGAAGMLLMPVLVSRPVVEAPQVLNMVLETKQVAPKPMAQSKPQPVQKLSQHKPQPHKNRESAPIKTMEAFSPITMPTSFSDQAQAQPDAQKAAIVAEESSSSAAVSASSAPPGPVASPQFNADYLSNPAPEYPAESRTKKEEGKVLLRIHVTEEGKPDEITLHRSSGFSRLDQVSLAVVERWKFIPGRQDGKPVAAWVVVPINFTLRN
jgi:protein TonB